MGISSVLTINGTSYTASQRAASSILPTGLSRSLEGGYDNFAFWEIPTSPAPSFKTGDTVSLAVDIGDGNGSVTRFSGVIVDVQSEHGELGWGHAYTAEGLKYLSDRIPVTAIDGTGQQIYNRSPLDEYFNQSDAGLEIGEIIRRVLTVPATAQLLNAVGIGDYTGLPSAPVLPAETLADLALMTIVPPRPVVFQGEGILNAIDQEAAQWMPKFFSEIEPSGKIRFKNSNDTTTYFPPQTITCPSASGAGDPVTPPRVRRSTKSCATRLILRGGPQVEVATLSLVDGTLAEVFTSTDKTNWNLTYFTAPKGATDYGSVTAVTSTSATLSSHDASATWTTNFWSNNNAIITLIDSVGSLISQFETRLVTSNNALSAGGTSTVNWDSTWPITATSYDKYRITGGAGGLNDCWRTYTPREPLTGNTGLNTYVGSHLVTRSAHAVRVANADQTFHAYYTTAIVKGGSLGQEMPLGVQAVPSEGIFRFTQPTVTVFGQASKLNLGSPTTAADGLPLDVVIYALYSRGALSVVVPPDVAGVPQHEGTAYTEDGVEVTKYLDFSQWLWINDTASFEALAQEALDSMSNAEVDLDIGWYLTPDGPVPAWDFLSFGYSLNIDIAGETSPWSNINAPVRQIGIKWDWTGRGSQFLSLSGSTRRRAFAGYDLYIHPEFAQGSPLGNAFQSATGNYQSFNDLLGIDTNQLQNGNYQAFNNYLANGGSTAPMTPSQLIDAMQPGPSGFTLQDVAESGRMIPADRVPKKPETPKPDFEPLKRPDSAMDAITGSVARLGKQMMADQDRAAIDKRNSEKRADAIMNNAVKAANKPLEDGKREALHQQERAKVLKEGRMKQNRHNLERLETMKQIERRREDVQKQGEAIRERSRFKQMKEWADWLTKSLKGQSLPDESEQ